MKVPFTIEDNQVIGNGQEPDPAAVATLRNWGNALKTILKSEGEVTVIHQASDDTLAIRYNNENNNGTGLLLRDAAVNYSRIFQTI